MSQITDLFEPVFVSVNYDPFNGIKTCYQRACERDIKGRELVGERKCRKKSRGICNTIAHPITQNVAVYFPLAHRNPHHPLLLSYRGNCS